MRIKSDVLNKASEKEKEERRWRSYLFICVCCTVIYVRSNSLTFQIKKKHMIKESQTYKKGSIEYRSLKKNEQEYERERERKSI